MTPDWRVALFTVGVALLAAILFGFAPALQIARQRRQSTLIRQILIGAQVAASCVLLIVAGLLVRALDRMTVGSSRVRVSAGDRHQPQPGLARLLAGSRRRPTWRRCGRGSSRCPASRRWRWRSPSLGRKKTVLAVDVDGRRVDVHVNNIETSISLPHAGHSAAARARLHSRRAAGRRSSANHWARSLWPGEDPLGKSFDDRIVVGVAGSARQTALQDPDAVEAYFPVEPSALPVAVDRW